ncbi:MAG: amidohydrolase family protein [Actinobacteria bacterium]|nr:amidohydrolase family protein [Actinomycetota bacterium]
MPKVGPGGLGIIETMMGFPDPDPRRLYEFFRGNIRDKESKETMFPVEYLFKQNVPGALTEDIDPVEVAINTMDHFGIDRSMIGIEGDPGVRALTEYPERFIPSCSADANNGVDEVRKIRRLHDEHGLKAVGTFPAGCTPQVPIDHARWYPIYSVCAELGIPIFVCAGIPGPRVPSMCQHVELLDIVCYDFPELKIVTRHGCQPWTELMVKLMLKWPNLYYSTSAFAPKHYDPRIIDYANTRGADRVIYAGYWPMGLTYERIMGDMPHVPFKDDVWPKFLRENALKVLGLPDVP